MKHAIIPAFYIAVFLVLSGLRVVNLNGVKEVRQFPDTRGYIEKATGHYGRGEIDLGRWSCQVVATRPFSHNIQS
jgi:hypothetical protein